MVSVYSSAETGMCKNGQLQYGYFITRVAICSPTPFKNSRLPKLHHRQKTTLITPEPCSFDPDLHMRPPCQQHSQLLDCATCVGGRPGSPTAQHTQLHLKRNILVPQPWYLVAVLFKIVEINVMMLCRDPVPDVS